MNNKFSFYVFYYVVCNLIRLFGTFFATFYNRQGTGGAWEPLDDWEAPYREPKLPPPDFVPNDTGVGVPLPPEDPEEPVEPQRNEIKSLKSPAKVKSLPPPPSPNFHDFIFDEERHISEVENFHSVRKAQQEEFFRNK